VNTARRTRARGLGRQLGWLPVLGLALAACASSDGGNRDPSWLEAHSPKKLEVEQADYRHAVYFETDQARLDAAQKDRLLDFLRAAELGPGDTIYLEGHADERASDLYNLDLAARRAESVRRFLDDQGVGAVGVRQIAYGERAPAAPGSTAEAWQQNRRVEVVIERYVVVLPPCPDWSRQSGTDFANLPHSNFGCATQTNLGLMVAEPRDLVRGRPLAPADGVREAEAIARYRAGETTELKQEVTN
jgi:pilus assembly protein CpaD